MNYQELMPNIIGDNMDDIYKQLIDNFNKYSQPVSNTQELQNVKFVLTNPLNSYISVRETSIDYALGELVWYAAGMNDVEFISNFGSMWKRLSDDGVTNNSAYGYIIQKKFLFDQLFQVIRQLTIDPTSRRAKININTPNPNSIDTNDEPCTLTLQFLVRDGKLFATTMMRSNDMWFGLPYDVIFFTAVQRYIARELNLELGCYTHFVTSMHIYDRNIEDINKAYDAKPIPHVVNVVNVFDSGLTIYNNLKHKGNIRTNIHSECEKFDIRIHQEGKE